MAHLWHRNEEETWSAMPLNGRAVDTSVYPPRVDHHSLNNASFDPVYVLMGHALPEEAQSDPAQRAGDAQTGV
ncbi:MAG: hypothetical protein ABSH56_27945, partial [Bryobacteraceae bacterium]